MPSEREIKTVMVKPGLFVSQRKPYRTSCQKLAIRAPLETRRDSYNPLRDAMPSHLLLGTLPDIKTTWMAAPAFMDEGIIAQSRIVLSSPRSWFHLDG